MKVTTISKKGQPIQYVIRDSAGILVVDGEGLNKYANRIK